VIWATAKTPQNAKGLTIAIKNQSKKERCGGNKWHVMGPIFGFKNDGPKAVSI